MRISDWSSDVCSSDLPPLSSLDFMRGSTSLLCFPFADVRSMRVIASFRPQEMKIYPVSPIQRYCLLVSGRKNYGADMNVGACLYFLVDLDSSIVINRLSKCLAFHQPFNLILKFTNITAF